MIIGGTGDVALGTKEQVRLPVATNVVEMTGRMRRFAMLRAPWSGSAAISS